MKIAIYNHGIPFDGATTTRAPLGGSESSIIYMARELVRFGHSVTVYANCPDPDVYDGVRYLHYHQFFSDYRFAAWDALIAFRSFDPMLLGRVAPRMIFWTGDACDQPSLANFGHAALQQNVDRVFCVSNWHRESFMRYFGLPAEKVVATRNGFVPEMVRTDAKRSMTRGAYTSTPFRGLDILLQMFPAIRERVPSATLDVFSSMQVYGWDSEADKKAYGALYDAARQPGVEWHGSVPQPVLLEALSASALLMYPNTFDETSCIAAIEAQAAGCVVITSAKAGLVETVAHGQTGFCLQGDPRSEDYRRRFIETAAGVMENRELFERMSEAARQRAFRIYSWGSIAAEWTSIIENIAPAPVTGRLHGPLRLLERAHDYLRSGNPAAARRVISNLEDTPFFAREAQQLKATLEDVR